MYIYRRGVMGRCGKVNLSKPSEVVLILMKWWAQQDLNLRPADYESDALTN